jgi:hypothetical protein
MYPSDYRSRSSTSGLGFDSSWKRFFLFNSVVLSVNRHSCRQRGVCSDFVDRAFVGLVFEDAHKGRIGLHGCVHRGECAYVKN